MFAVVFNADRKPIDDGDVGGPWNDVHVVGRARHVALLRRDESSPKDAETVCVVGAGRRHALAGRIRLDARDELVAALRPSGSRPSDADLVLAAYAKRGEDFTEHLAGDFCLALWDDDRGRLLCVRDQLGVRSLYAASVGRQWLVSDSLAWITGRTPSAREIDDVWIGDFLGIGFSVDADRTVWRGVRRIAPAHVLTLGEEGAASRRYWQLFVDEPLRYRDRRQYTEHFRELTTCAVSDRLPSGTVGVSMSGGLDSPLLAACAVEASGSTARVVGECVYYQSLLPDEEHLYGKQAADYLGVELHLTAMDAAIYDPLWRTRSIHSPEPTGALVNAYPDREISCAMAHRSGVWLYGEGPDNALQFERNTYLGWLWRQRRWGALAAAAWGLVRAKGLAGWSDTLRRSTGRGPPEPEVPTLPPWLDRGFVARIGLEDRLAAVDEVGAVSHPWHPRAISSFMHPVWNRFFTSFEFEESQAPLVWRHPFLDLRVLRFMLAVPPVPWARDKLLLREAMAGRLPQSVLRRAKTPLSDNPLAVALGGQTLPPLASRGELRRWVAVDDLPFVLSDDVNPEKLVAAHVLDHWLAEVAGVSAER